MLNIAYLIGLNSNNWMNIYSECWASFIYCFPTFLINNTQECKASNPVALFDTFEPNGHLYLAGFIAP